MSYDIEPEWLLLLFGRGRFIFGVCGFAVNITRDLPVLFSERYGYRRVYRFSKRWSLQLFSPWSK